MTHNRICSATPLDVWSIHMAMELQRVRTLRTTLSREERMHADRFRRQADRDRYIIAHGALRQLLQRYTGIPAAELRIEQAIGGKPFLAAEEAPLLSFNLSHSADRALVAVAQGQRVGVDIERIDPDVDGLGIASRFFSPSEHATLLAADESVRLRRFFHLWVCKEAYIKARGESISGRLATFSIDGSEQMHARLSEDASDLSAPEKWQIRLLEIDATGYAAAVAIEGEAGPPRLIHWHSKDDSSDFAPSPEIPAA